MGRTRELTEAERAELGARGYRPIEVWVPDHDAAYWLDVERECHEIARAENAAAADLFLDAVALDAIRLIEEEEAAGRLE